MAAKSIDNRPKAGILSVKSFSTDDDGRSLTIVPVTDERELQLVGRLRYAVTVEEMRLNMVYADHSRRTVVEPLDSTAHVLAALAGEEVVGTVRGNLLSRSNIGHYYEAYALGRFPADARATMSITTRLAIDRRYRSRGLFLRLADEMYRYYLQQRVSHDVIDCRKPLARYFFRLGYRLHKPDLTHREFGDVTVLYLAVTDERFLRAVRSPFFDSLMEYGRQAVEATRPEGAPLDSVASTAATAPTIYPMNDNETDNQRMARNVV